jgi:hypothetical protein
MPAAYVVTEGHTDAEILKRCLPETLTKDTYIAVGEGWSSAMSLAGSILSVKARPVALVVDSDSEDEAAIEERRAFTRSFLRRTSVGVPFDVFLAVPEFEAVLFQGQSLIGRLVGRDIPGGEFETARLRPKKWLAAADVGYPKEIARLLDRLTEKDLAVIRSHELIRGLSEFLTRVLAENGSPPGRGLRAVQL